VVSRALRREVKRAVRCGVWGISRSVGGGAQGGDGLGAAVGAGSTGFG